MQIKIIGITGPSGSGKSILGQFLRNHGIDCIDADAVYHSLLVPPSRCLEEIAKAFGNDILLPDGNLNRQLLSAIVFQSPEKLTLLNRTVLPIVIDAINESVHDADQKGQKWIAVDAPTLIESGFYRSCHCIVTVFASEADRIERIMLRDGITQEKAQERVQAQKPLHFYTDLSHFTLENNNDLAAFHAKCKSLLNQILSMEFIDE